MTCKFCQSDKVVKHGKKGGSQRYLCKKCGHKFVENQNTLPRMRTPTHIIVTALNLYFEGLSARKICTQIEQIYGEKSSPYTVWAWVQKFSKIANDYVKTLTPTVSGKIHHDETVVKIDGVNHVGEGGLLGMALHRDFENNSYTFQQDNASVHTAQVIFDFLKKAGYMPAFFVGINL